MFWLGPVLLQRAALLVSAASGVQNKLLMLDRVLWLSLPPERISRQRCIKASVGRFSLPLHFTHLRGQLLDSRLTFSILWCDFLVLFLLTRGSSGGWLVRLFVLKLSVEIRVQLLNVRLSRHSAARRGYEGRQRLDLFL